MKLKKQVQSLGLKTALSYIEKNPTENMLKLLDWVKKFDKENHYKNAYDMIGGFLSDPKNNWYGFIQNLYQDIDVEQRKVIFQNFLLNSAISGITQKQKLEAKYDCNIPWAILMDPTSACNLKCIGCWAAEYGHKLNLPIETLDDIIHQGKALGTYMYIYSGGEPLVRKKDIITLCERHPDVVFLAFTNATLIDEDFALEMARVKNFIPAMSIEGFEADTDFRRGFGTYEAVLRAMEILRAKKLLFGVSCCYTSKNYETIGSEAYFDDLIAKGAKFAWFFTYMPIGKNAVVDLMATPAQRTFMYEKIRAYRQTKPIFTMDFWNDGEYVKGCIAGGRSYLHINANGDIEPCAFIHYSDSNIKEKTLLEAYQSPLFMQYRKNQPFCQNHLRPCPLLDNPGRLTQMVEKSGAHSTDLESPENVRDLSAKCLHAAEGWKPQADALWKESHGPYRQAK